MYFQIFKGCGTPRRNPSGAGRLKREANYDDFHSGNFMDFSNQRHSNERPDTAAGTNLDKLVRDINNKVWDG